MTTMQKSLCVFIHYGEHSYLPNYVRIYINELLNYFDQTILVTNKRALKTESLFPSQNGSVLFVENEGYDFGMFFKAIQSIDISEYHQIACINDSNIIFAELDPIFNWGLNQQADFWGLIDSHEAPWFSSHPNNYHIQSHFLVFNEKAIKCLPLFFANIDVKSIFNEKDKKQLRKLIIDQWEIGLSQFLLKKGLQSASFFNSLAFSAKYNRKGKNITKSFYKELIMEGYPLFKKNFVVKKSWRSYIGLKEPWVKLIEEHATNQWNIPLLIDEMRSI